MLRCARYCFLLVAAGQRPRVSFVWLHESRPRPEAKTRPGTLHFSVALGKMGLRERGKMLLGSCNRGVHIQRFPYSWSALLDN
jgi:hypothetical protein